MRSPSVENLMVGLSVTKETANKIKDIMKNARGVRTTLWEISRILELHGVEAIRFSREDKFQVLYYVNTGETYNATICAYSHSDRFFLASWGDLVDGRQQQGWTAE